MRTRLYPQCRMVAYVCVVSAAWALATPCPADEPASSPSVVGGAEAASNQAVTLDHPSLDQESIELPRRQHAPANPEHRVTLRPRSRAASTVTSQPTQTTPWYRTAVGALGLVLAIIGLAVWAFRRWVPAARALDNEVLKVVGRAGLTPKHSLALVRIGRRFVLVGVSGDRISRLGEIADPDEVAELATRVSASDSARPGSFGNLFLHEAATYGDDEEPSDAKETAQALDSQRARSLTDLLQKLRSMKAG